MESATIRTCPRSLSSIFTSEAVPAPSTDGGPAAPSPAQAATNELSALVGNPDFVSDFDGSNGRQAQIQARDRKTALTRQAHGGTEETAAPLPTQIQEGLNSPDPAVRAAAEAMRPGETAGDFIFTWSDASTIGLDDSQNMNSIAAEAAFSIGANPQYARSTVAFIDKQLATNTSGEQLTPAHLDTALADKFGSDGQACLTSAPLGQIELIS
jgi:hypothetical protein